VSWIPLFARVLPLKEEENEIPAVRKNEPVTTALPRETSVLASGTREKERGTDFELGAREWGRIGTDIRGDTQPRSVK